ncbi:MAG: outer membrane beta-barrel protein [Planctomycetota bacterium]|nr:outer membrane beta-barrel protein [Planctomycetota bacterium]
MKIKGFKTFAALLAALFGITASDVLGQSGQQYLISDQTEIQQAKANPTPNATVGTQDDAATDAAVADATADSGNVLELGGWLQGGYHSYNTGMFNNRDSEFNLHQAYFYAEKAANADNGLGLGFRMDYVYGIDAQDTQAFFGPASSWDNTWDNGAYGHALPQLYAEMAWGDLNVKVGKFYTIMGYETVTAPDNFFYSHAFTMFNSEPFTHTGVLGEFDMGDVTLFGGYTMGWDSGFDTSIGDGSNFLGGGSLAFGDGATITHTMTVGRLGAGSTQDGYSHSFVADMHLTDGLNFVIQSDYVDNPNINESYGVNTYLTLDLNEQVSIGTRMEWWNTHVTGARTGSSDLYAITHGVNIKLADNLIIRPEARWNKDDDGILINGNHNNRYGFGMDMIMTY